MNSFSTQTTINAPIAEVWRVLADIGSIAQWNPGVIESYNTTTEAEGIGACRHCDLGGKNFLDEAVVEWEPESKLTMRITGTNMPFQKADIRFRLEPVADGTAVTVSPVYALKYGPIGVLMDRLFVRSTYQKGMASLLAGLKKHVEAESA